MISKRNILFVINNLRVGGAEKALVSMLQVFDYEKYNVDLLLISKDGGFLDMVPKEVNILPEIESFKNFDGSFSMMLKRNAKKGNFKIIFDRILQYFINSQSKLSASEKEQLTWKVIRKHFKSLPNHYDVAIGFLEKTPNYFVIEKVSAAKKIGYIHNDYNALRMDKNFDEPYFKRLDFIVSISEECVNILKIKFPEYADKIKLIKNIVSPSFIRFLAEKESVILSKNAILSVGRLNSQKGFDLAIQAASILMSKNVDFHWYVIGEGEEIENLLDMTKKYNVSNFFTFLGLKLNPYPYIKSANVYVQPSRFEGKSIAIDEAKILNKPIVLTNFSTASDQINQGVNGLICEMHPIAISEAIQSLLSNENLSEKLTKQLALEDFNTESEIEKLYQLIEN